MLQCGSFINLSIDNYNDKILWSIKHCSLNLKIKENDWWLDINKNLDLTDKNIFVCFWVCELLRLNENLVR